MDLTNKTSQELLEIKKQYNIETKSDHHMVLKKAIKEYFDKEINEDFIDMRKNIPTSDQARDLEQDILKDKPESLTIADNNTFEGKIINEFYSRIKDRRAILSEKDDIGSSAFIFHLKDISDTSIKKFCIALINYLENNNLSIKRIENFLTTNQSKKTIKISNKYV